MKKESLYYYDKSKVYRPNRSELSQQLFNCPHCKSLLSRPRHRAIKIIYCCPNCGFQIEEENILSSPDKIQERKDLKKDQLVNSVMKDAKWVK